MREKHISSFINAQFPSFYQEEGPNFIAFVKAYYEWLESTNQTLNQARSLLEYIDIDTTEAKFIKYFKNTYIQSMPESIVADKRLLVKHILDLYRTKGSPRAYQLLFRLLYNENIEMYIPGDYLFSPSSGEWQIPRYIEVTSNPYIHRLVGKQIYNSSKTATAIVENVTQKIVNLRTINVLYISSLDGRFKYDEKILCDSLVDKNNVPLIKISPTQYSLQCTTSTNQTTITTTNSVSKLLIGMFVSGTGITDSTRIAAITLGTTNEIVLSLAATTSGLATIKFTEVFYSPPVVIGSLTAIAIENGGYGFSPGNIVDISGGGQIGKARIAAVRDEEGKVGFTLLDGGSGFTKTATVTVATALYLRIEQLPGINNFTTNTKIISANSNANATVTFANDSFIQTINFSSNLVFNIGDTVTGVNGANAKVISVIGGGGIGAGFQIGDIINKEIYYINTDIVEGYTGLANSSGEFPGGADLESQIRINTGVQTNAFTPGHAIHSTANVLILEGIHITSNVVSNSEYFSNTSLGVSNLHVVKSDVNMIWVTGSEAQLDNANIIANAVFISNTSSSIYKLIDTPTKQTITANAIIYITNTSTITANVTSITSGSPYFIPGATVISTANNAVNAAISSQYILTDWLFPSRVGTGLLTNLDSILNQTLVFQTLETGKISYISNINPGSGYSSDPYVDIIESTVASINEDDGFGGIKGHNAVVNAVARSASGIVTAVEVINSGFGFVPNETVHLTSNNGSNIAVTGAAVIDMDGKGDGYWKDNKGFLSDIIKIQDSYYYQEYSYEIVVSRMITTYEALVTDLIHPTGTKMFGRFQINNYQVADGSQIKSFSNIANSSGGIISQS